MTAVAPASLCGNVPVRLGRVLRVLDDTDIGRDLPADNLFCGNAHNEAVARLRYWQH